MTHEANTVDRVSSLGLDEEHVKLWQYFEDRASALKDSLFKLMTWLLGFASALVAYAGQYAFNWNAPSVVTNPVLLLGVAGAGLALVLFAVRIIGDFGAHINRNFARATAARRPGAELEEIITSVGGSDQKLPNICRWVRAVTVAFGVVFASGLLLGLIRLACECR